MKNSVKNKSVKFGSYVSVKFPSILLQNLKHGISQEYYQNFHLEKITLFILVIKQSELFYMELLIYSAIDRHFYITSLTVRRNFKVLKWRFQSCKSD